MRGNPQWRSRRPQGGVGSVYLNPVLGLMENAFSIGFLVTLRTWISER